MGEKLMSTVEEIINIGFDNHQSGRLEEAESAYQEALNLDCENAEVCNLMGVLKLQQNEVDSAIDWVEKAINRKQCEYFYETLFQAYIRAGSFDKIIECENSVLSNYPKNFSLLFWYKSASANSLVISAIFFSISSICPGKTCKSLCWL